MNAKATRVLFVGDLSVGSNSLSLMEGFRELGLELCTFDTAKVTSARLGSWAWFCLKFLHSPPNSFVRFMKAQLLELSQSHKPDFLIALKTIQFPQSLFLDLDIPLKAHLSFDDVSNLDNVSQEYLDSESKWDLIITTKKHNIEELTERGVRNVKHIWGAYDPKRCFVSKDFTEREFELGFIGAARPDRFSLPKEIAAGLPGRGVVAGPRWARLFPFGFPGVKILGSVYGHEYSRLSNEIRIGLLLLNSENRDTHTNRSFEMPACGQVVLGERTSEHLEMFDEGTEALFFSSRIEMWEKVQFLLDNPSVASDIASAGHRRITGGLNTYRDRAAEIIYHLRCMTNEPLD